MVNPILVGWIQYHGRLCKTELIYKLYDYLDERLLAWLAQKHKRRRGHRQRALLVAFGENQEAAARSVRPLATCRSCGERMMGAV